MKAEEDQALGGPLEPDEPADEADPQSDSDSSDAGFGLMKDSKAKSAAAPKKGVKPRRQPDETEKPQPAPARPSRSSPEELQQKGEELLMTLRGFSPVGFFTGALKEKDWDGKLNKTLTFVGQLETFDDEESKNVAKGLQQTAEEITDRMETLKGVKGLESGTVVQDLPTMSADVVRKLGSLPADCLTAVLTECGRKLLQALKF